MDGSTIVLITTFLVSFIDCILVSYQSYKLTEQKPKAVLMFVVSLFYGIALVVLSLYLKNYTFKAIITITSLLIIKWITSKKIHDSFILYAFIFLCILFVQIIATLLIVNIFLIGNHTALLAQVLSLIIIIMSYQRIPLHKIFNTIERQILLKLFVFMVLFFYLLAFSYFSFDYLNITEYIMYFALLLLLPAIGLSNTIKSIYFYTNKVPMQLHDVKNVLIGLHISAKGSSDKNTIKDELNKALEIIGMDDINTESIDVDTYYNSILSFINMKKKRSTKELSFSTNIQYYESNAKIPLATILYMLGVLLDNAIDSGTKKVIYIKVHVSERYILVSVSNQYKKRSTDDFKNMFQERYTTKHQDNSMHGYGLPNLSRVVHSFGGEIQLEYSYNKEEETNYLTFTIDIKN